MLLKERITAERVFSGTGKYFLFALFDCSLAYYADEIILSRFFTFPAFIPATLGTVLAFFIGFNNNQSYDRWWEARKIWGSIVNNSRTFTRQILTFVQDKGNPEIKAQKRYMVKRHITYLYALKMNLRNEPDKYFYKHISDLDYVKVKHQTNLPNALLMCQSDDILHLYEKGYIDQIQFLELNKMLTEHTNDLGASERLKNTVFPTVYNFYSKYFIWIFIYCATMSMGNGVGIWAIPFGTLIGYAFFTIQSLGQLLVNPFEKDNKMGIPLDSITRTIEINLLEMLKEKDIPEPIQSVRGEYIM